jgi:hypothetical protein
VLVRAPDHFGQLVDRSGVTGRDRRQCAVCRSQHGQPPVVGFDRHRLGLASCVEPAFVISLRCRQITLAKPDTGQAEGVVGAEQRPRRVVALPSAPNVDHARRGRRRIDRQIEQLGRRVRCRVPIAERQLTCTPTGVVTAAFEGGAGAAEGALGTLAVAPEPTQIRFDELQVAEQPGAGGGLAHGLQLGDARQRRLQALPLAAGDAAPVAHHGVDMTDGDGEHRLGRIGEVGPRRLDEPGKIVSLEHGSASPREAVVLADLCRRPDRRPEHGGVAGEVLGDASQRPGPEVGNGVEQRGVTFGDRRHRRADRRPRLAHRAARHVAQSE